MTRCYITDDSRTLISSRFSYPLSFSPLLSHSLILYLPSYLHSLSLSPSRRRQCEVMNGSVAYSNRIAIITFTIYYLRNSTLSDVR